MNKLCLLLLTILTSSAWAGEVKEKLLNGRFVAWDSMGLAPLDAERPLSVDDGKLLDDLKAANLAKADAAAWKLLRTEQKAFVPAWTLVQCATIRKSWSRLYSQQTTEDALKGVDPAVAAYLRYEATRLQIQRISPRLTGGKESPDYEKLSNDLDTARVSLERFSSQYLPAAVALMQGYFTPVSLRRQVIEDYKASHPKGPNVDLLLCRAYLNGVLRWPVSASGVAATGHPLLTGREDEPQPGKLIDLCQKILKDNPKQTLAHYFLGRAYYYERKDSKALSEMKLVTQDDQVLEPVADSAKAYLANPSGDIPRLKLVE